LSSFQTGLSHCSEDNMSLVITSCVLDNHSDPKNRPGILTQAKQAVRLPWHSLEQNVSLSDLRGSVIGTRNLMESTLKLNGFNLSIETFLSMLKFNA